KVVAPHMVGSFRPQSHTGAILQPQSTPGPLFGGYFQPFAPPDALHSILAHSPPRPLQQRPDPPIAVASVLRGQGDNGSRQCILVVALDRLVPLGSAPLLQQPASVTFRHPVLFSCTLYRTTTPLRA